MTTALRASASCASRLNGRDLKILQSFQKGYSTAERLRHLATTGMQGPSHGRCMRLRNSNCGAGMCATAMLWNANANNDDKGSLLNRVRRTNINDEGHPRSLTVERQDVTRQHSKRQDFQSYAVQMALTIYTNPAALGYKRNQTKEGVYTLINTRSILEKKAQTERSSDHDIIDIPISSYAFFRKHEY